MLSFSHIPSIYYSSILIWTTTLLAIATALRYVNSNENTILIKPYKVPIMTFAVVVVYILFLGFRDPYDWKYFSDNVMYTHVYNHYGDEMQTADVTNEWLWDYIIYVCRSFNLEVNHYLLIIEALYIGFMFLACHRLMRHNVWIAILFCLTSYSFYGYAVNGLRNGMACSMLTYAIALMTDKKKFLVAVGIVLGILCMGIHRSTTLPLLCAIAGLTVIKRPSWAIGFWVASILISLVAGNAVGDFFANLGFDDRERYFTDASTSFVASEFSSTGFRFDFLLYSAMPVLMVWYTTVKRNFNDKAYNIIAITYILANAFWIMVIRAQYSNRFAYLSWFLYPIVIAYPLLRFKMWDDQDRKTAIILALYAGFKVFMDLIGK